MPAMPAPMMTILRALPGGSGGRPGIGRGYRQQAHRRHGAIGGRHAAGLADQMDQPAARQAHAGRRARKRRGQRAVVQHVQRAADRHALRHARHRDAERPQPVGQPMRGGGAVDRGAERQDHLVRRRPRQPRASSGARSDPRARRRPAPRACRPARDRGRDAPPRAPAPRDRPRPRRRRSTARSRCGSVQIEHGSRLSRLPHIGARPHRARRLGERGGERQHPRLRLLQHPQRRAARAARPDAGQFGQQADQVLDFRTAHDADRIRLSDQPRARLDSERQLHPRRQLQSRR